MKLTQLCRQPNSGSYPNVRNEPNDFRDLTSCRRVPGAPGLDFETWDDHCLRRGPVAVRDFFRAISLPFELLEPLFVVADEHSDASHDPFGFGLVLGKASHDPFCLGLVLGKDVDHLLCPQLHLRDELKVMGDGFESFVDTWHLVPYRGGLPFDVFNVSDSFTPAKR